MDDLPTTGLDQGAGTSAPPYMLKPYFTADGLVDLRKTFGRGTTIGVARSACFDARQNYNSYVIFIVDRTRVYNGNTYYQYLYFIRFVDGYLMVYDPYPYSSSARYINFQNANTYGAPDGYYSINLPGCMASTTSYLKDFIPNPYNLDKININFYAFIMAIMVIILAVYTVIYKWWRRRL